MFTLIKREIEDHIAYFIGAAVLSAVLIALLISAMYQPEPRDMPVFIGLSIPAIVILIIGFPAMGATQMYTDRTRKISTLLSTLPVSRRQILCARIITGILAILTLLLPLTITMVILFPLFTPPIQMYPGLVWEIFAAAFLMAFACYCLGLLTGWNSSKIIPTLGGLVLTGILLPLILVKGFGLHTVVILLLFIIASLMRTWHTFMSTSL
jgi:ABC-type transport system involved in multi-copper enzyme maturation permease subunit